jgi:hypothetical protein
MRSMRGMMVVGFVMLGVLAPPGPSAAQPAWSYALHWEHDGASVTHFRMCVDGACEIVSADRVSSSTWSARLPLLSAGDHRIILEACNVTVCTAGRPEVFVRVQSVAVGPPVTSVPPPPVKSKDPRLVPRGAYPDPQP